MESADPRHRLLELSEAKGASLAALSRMLGKNASYLQQFVRKGSPRKLEEVDRARLARYFGVPEAELGAPKDKSRNDSVVVRQAAWVNVPRLMLGASAGPGVLEQAEAAFDHLRFSARWLRELGIRSDRLSAIAVSGDSMEPTLRDGDEILVDCSPPPLQDGIWVVRLDDMLMVKRLETGRPGVITLLSDNPAYRAMEYRTGEIVPVGRVVWKGGRI